MRTAASIADVKARLSEFVRRVKAGNEVSSRSAACRSRA